MANTNQPGLSSVEDSHRLIYPELVDTNDPHDSNAFDTAAPFDMDTDGLSEDGHNSLSDSTFEIISQSSFHTSDDDYHEDGTESMVSFGIPTPEEGSSVAGDEYMPPQQASSSQASSAVANTDQPECSHEFSTSSLDTAVNQYRHSPDASVTSHDDWIKFKEPISSVASGLLNVTGSTRAPQSRELRSKAMGILEATLSDQIVELNGPFRILFYAASSDIQLKGPVLEKIGQALHISVTPPSVQNRVGKEKLNIVPISSFGHETTGQEIILVPFTGLQIEVDDCSEGDTSGSSKVIEDKDRRPNLAIFVHPHLSSDFARLKTSLEKSQELKLRRVPVIDICGDPPSIALRGRSLMKVPNELASLRFVPCKDRAVHMAWESPGRPGEEPNRFMTPIDFQTFQSIDAIELNRNIAAITTGPSSVLDFQDAQWIILSWVKAIWLNIILLYAHLTRVACQGGRQLLALAKATHSNAIKPLFREIKEHSAGFERHILTGLVLSVLCCSGLLLYRHTSLLPPPISYEGAKISATQTEPIRCDAMQALPTIQRTLPAPEIPLLLSGSRPALQTRALMAVEIETGLSTVHKPHKTASKHVAKAIVEFKILEANDGRLFLQSIKPLPPKWKPSSNFVSVVQGEKNVETSFSKTENSLFELHLGAVNRCKPMTVTVQSNERLGVTQTFEVHQRCNEKPSMEKLVDLYFEILSPLHAKIPQLRRGVHESTTGLLSSFMESFGSSYTRWRPKVTLMMKQSRDQAAQFAKSADRARHALNEMADQRLDFIADYVNEKALTAKKALIEELSAARTAWSRKQRLLYRRVVKLKAAGWTKFSPKENLPYEVPATVKLARSRALFVKETASGWISSVQTGLQRLAEQRREKCSRRSGHCKSRRKRKRSRSAIR